MLHLLELFAAHALKPSALSAIAMEYDTSDSDSEVQEVTEHTQNSGTEKEMTNEQNPVILKEYRTNIEVTCSSDEVDSEDDSSNSEESGESKSESSSDSSSEDESRNTKSEKEKLVF